MRKLLYLARVSILLVAVTLIAGMAGCSESPSPFGSPEYPIIHFACGEQHTVGLKFDGTATAVGSNSYFQCNVDDWTNIIGVAAGYFHTVGLKADGTVVTRGWNYYKQCEVRGWMDIIRVAAG
ncbi:MAG: hypothetical protein E3I25_03915, partial [Dehalococcoidia bacterium]